jgi:hypothetical protein
VVLSLSSSTMTPVRRRLGGGAGGRLVRAGGAVVVLQAVSGFSRVVLWRWWGADYCHG